jgi:hypothetical protein
MKFGEDDPGVMGTICPCESSIVLMEVDLASPREGLREETADGKVDVREG